MKCNRLDAVLLGLLGLVLVSGCMVPQARLSSCQQRERALSEQCRAQVAEIDNLKVHNRNIEDKLLKAEEDLALLEEQVGLDRQQLANYESEHGRLHAHFRRLLGGQSPLPAEVSQRLAELSKRYPSIQFDPVTGIGKLDTDIVFDTGEAQLKSGGEQLLNELVAILNRPEAADLKIMVVGHTDDRQVAKRPAREKFPNNFHLSTARAHAVADRLLHSGLATTRLGVAGFGAHQPVAPNVSARDRQKNRRVEIFVMNRDVPVVGWTESTPTLYR